MRKLALLDIENSSEVDFPSLGQVRRSESDIRSAVGRLENPSHRIADRLFWLHSTTERPDASDVGDIREPLKKSSYEHDQALESLFRVYSSTSLSNDHSAWTDALRRWHTCVESEDYWKLSSVLEHLGAFEPTANADESRLLRGNAMLMASEPLLIIARQAVADNDLVLIAVLYGMATPNSSATSQSSIYQPTASSTTSDSASSDATRNDLKVQIDAGRARIEALKLELEPVANEMGTLKSQIQDLDSQMKTLDDQKSSGESIDIDDYNAKVNRYNDLVSQRKLLYTEHKASFDEYEDLLKKDDVLIAQYNALPR